MATRYRKHLNFDYFLRFYNSILQSSELSFDREIKQIIISINCTRDNVVQYVKMLNIKEMNFVFIVDPDKSYYVSGTSIPVRYSRTC